MFNKVASFGVRPFCRCNPLHYENIPPLVAESDSIVNRYARISYANQPSYQRSLYDYVC